MTHLLMDFMVKFMVCCASSHFSMGSGVLVCRRFVSWWMLVYFNSLNLMRNTCFVLFCFYFLFLFVLFVLFFFNVWGMRSEEDRQLGVWRTNRPRGWGQIRA